VNRSLNARLAKLSGVRLDWADPAASVEARGSLLAYAKLQWPGFRTAPHHKLIADHLEAVARGEIKRLMISMPPRHGKSMLASEFFPAWTLGRNPSWQVIAASYGQDLADDFGRKVRNQIGDPLFQQVFPGVRLQDDSTSSKRFGIEPPPTLQLEQSGTYFAAGVGGPLTGRGANLLLIDDAIKGREDANSETMQRRIREWYTSVAYTRLMPGGAVVAIGTRWAELDLLGWLETEQAHEGWTILKLPAIAEPNDPVGREPGEALWSDQYPLEALERIRRTLPPVDWSALYSQAPAPPEGDFFRSEWLVPVNELPDLKTLRVYGGSDYALSEGKGDYTVHACLGIAPDGAPWLLDLYRKQSAPDESIAALVTMIQKYRPVGWAEEAGVINGALGPFITRTLREKRAHVARETFPTKGDKQFRASSMRGYIATHGLRILTGAPYRNDLISELLLFPNGSHDDAVDALALCFQLLETMGKGRIPKPPEPEKRKSGYRSALDDGGSFSINAF
jgi:predicted phage terminase large subunit-like protein